MEATPTTLEMRYEDDDEVNNELECSLYAMDMV